MRLIYWIMCFLSIVGCFISIKAGDVSAAIDKATISMLWYIIIKHNDWVDELKHVIDIMIDKLNDTIEEAEKELQNSREQ